MRGEVDGVVGLVAGEFIGDVIGFPGAEFGIVDCSVADVGVVGLVNGVLELERVEVVDDIESSEDGRTSVFEGFLDDLAPRV